MHLIIHGPGIGPEHLDAVQGLTGARSPRPCGRPAPHGVAGYVFSDANDNAVVRAQVKQWSEENRLDFAWLERPRRLEEFGLLVMDMDSTLVNIETIDEIADFCGRKQEVAAITEAAMRGEIADYSESLRRRVALLEGLPLDALTRVYEQRMQLTAGAETLLAAAQAAGLKTLLVSGGFDFFTDRLRDRLHLSFARSNTLGIEQGRLTGEVLGQIVDADLKARTVETTCAEIGILTDRAIVMGDGANDLKMMALAGVSVAFRAKPVVQASATMAFDFCGLDGLLQVLD